MRKRLPRNFPVSALLSGLLATPLLASPLPPVRTTQSGTSGQALVLPAEVESTAQPFPAEMAAELQALVEAVADGQALDAYGMQKLHRRMTQQTQRFLRIPIAAPAIRPGNGTSAIIIDPSPPPVDAPGMPVPTPPNPAAITPVIPNPNWTYAPHNTFSGISNVNLIPTEKAPFLGISTAPVDAALRAQLHIPRGTGLGVDYIEKGSPADAAGVQLHDILQKFDDQLLVNPQQLAVLVRSKNPGDAVTFTLLRDGKPLTISATLVEKQVPVLEDLPFGQQSSIQTSADGLSTRTLVDGQNDITLATTKDGQKTLIVKDREGHILYNGPADHADLPAETLAKVKALQDKSTGTGFRSTVTLPDSPPTNGDSTTISRTDDAYKIVLHSDARGRTLSVKDLKSGKSLFEGFFTSDDDLKDLPPAVIDRVKALNGKAR